MKKIIITAALFAGFIHQAQAVEQPASAAVCLACHAVDTQKVGPSFKDVATKYGAEGKDQIINSIKNGSKGVWGAAIMPPNQVSDEDAAALADWIISTAE